MEQRKFVVPEVVVGKNVMELIGRYLGHFGSRKTMIVTDKNILKLNWFQNIINNLMKKDIEYIIFDEVSNLTACTGMDALTHAIEAYVSNAASPLTDVHALKAIELIKKALPNAVSSNKEEVMEDMLMGSLHAGFAFSNASLGAVHALAHSLGGVLDLPHGQCNSMLLEHVIDLNFEYAQDRYKDIAVAVGCEVEGLSSEEIKACLIDVISKLRERLSIPEKLSEKINPELAEELYVNAINDPCMVTNPKNLSYKEVKGIYEKIFKE